MSSNTAFTKETCPTTEAEIIATGRFNMRLIAEQFGMLADAGDKQSFLAMSTEGQAKAILAKKLEFDKQTKGGSGKAATTKAAPVTRTPVTSKSNKTNAGPKEEESAGNSGGTGGDGKAGLAVLEKLGEILEAVANNTASVEALRDEVAAVQAQGAGTNLLARVAICVSLQMAGNLANAAPTSVLTAAIADLGDIEPQLSEILGSAEGGAQDEAEGND